MLNLHAGIKRCHGNTIQLKVTSTCPFVANKMSVYMLLKATTLIELLEFYSTNSKKIKSLFEKISSQNIPHPPIMVHSREIFN